MTRAAPRKNYRITAGATLRRLRAPGYSTSPISATQRFHERSSVPSMLTRAAMLEPVAPTLISATIVVPPSEPSVRHSSAPCEPSSARKYSTSSIGVNKVGEEDKLFGSVTGRDITEALAKKGVQLDHKKLVIPEAIKTIGIHTVEVKLGQGVSGQVKLVVAPLAK
jgi:hypothetical protein